MQGTLPGGHLISVDAVKEISSYFCRLNRDVQHCEMLSPQQPGQNAEGLPEVLQDTQQHQAKMWDILERLKWQEMSVLRQCN